MLKLMTDPIAPLGAKPLSLNDSQDDLQPEQKKLKDYLKKNADNLYYAKSSLNMLKLIGEYSQKINDANHGRSFFLIQRALITFLMNSPLNLNFQ